MGDGECDEPESLGAISLAAREQLDNLIFVVNCNLQRLDGPVRGNGKVIQELEAMFRGAGWNVIKVIWGSKWDELLAQDKDGVLLNQMNTTVDGQFQRYSVESGEYIRDHFFGPDPRLREMVAHLTDDELRNLPRGGHDYRKLYAAYKAATENLGSGAPDRHPVQDDQGLDARRGLRGPQRHPPDQEDDQGPARRPARPAVPARRDPRGLDRRRRPAVLHPGRGLDRVPVHDGAPPGARRVDPQAHDPRPPPAASCPSDKPFAELRGGSGNQEVSTTMGFTRLLRNLARDEHIGPRVVPIIPDEARTFGMDALFRELKIYAAQGQKYEPVDHDLLLSYTESSDGQILEEGITEAGSMASFIAAGTSYAHRGVPMVPFYTFYSMFGFQRVGDLIWQAADARARGFLLGATAGRTTLLGEGLQHQDGHSLVLASTVPAVPGLRPGVRLRGRRHRPGRPRTACTAPDVPPEERDVFYYLTLYNENYVMPPMPEGNVEAISAGIVDGLYKWQTAPEGPSHRATMLFSGSAQGAARAAADELAEHFDVGAELWSATSYKRLREDALAVERWNRLHPDQPARTPRVTELLADSQGPIVAVTDFMTIVPEQIARFVPGRSFTPLGTDGMGRSDTREALRRFFEVDTGHVVVATLAALAAQGDVKPEVVTDAIARYDIDPEAVNPYLV